MAGKRRLKRTAHHEAGHAVVAWFLNVPFSHVTIKPNQAENYLGRIQIKLPSWFKPDLELTPRIRQKAEHDIIMSFAGQIAEKRFMGKHPRWGMESDNQRAVNMADRFCGSTKTVEAYLRYCFYAARDHVKVRWKEIQAVAAALLERETLTREETRAVICLPLKTDL